MHALALQHIRDKKLKGQIVEREKLFGEAAETATKVQEVCLPRPRALALLLKKRFRFKVLGFRV